MTTTYYSVQVNEDGSPKRVPHTGKTNCEFLDRKKALGFLEKLKKLNSDAEFRLLKRIETYKSEEWK
jgi:hypothetical protein